MVKLIELTQKQYAIIDDEDYEELSKYSWCAAWSTITNTFYVMSSDTNHKTIRMHQIIMKPPKGFDVDHANGNPLDNRRCNLRICTRSQNVINTGINSRNTSGYKGVTWHTFHSLWNARIGFNNCRIHIGYFNNAIDAAHAYDIAAIRLFGEFAKLNFPDCDYNDISIVSVHGIVHSLNVDLEYTMSKPRKDMKTKTNADSSEISIPSQTVRRIDVYFE